MPPMVHLVCFLREGLKIPALRAESETGRLSRFFFTFVGKRLVCFSEMGNRLLSEPHTELS